MTLYSDLTGDLGGPSTSSSTVRSTPASPTAASTGTPGSIFADLTKDLGQPTGATPSAPQPALHPTVGGWFGNLWHGFTGMVTGLTGLVQMGVHDYAGLMEQAFIPGQQSIEKDIEQHGYQIAAVAKALPSAIKSDYATRYGGFSNILRGLYENPLAYVTDALMLVGGAGAVAKVGRVGVLAGLPEIVPEALAQKILGAEPILEATTGEVLGRKILGTTIDEATGNYVAKAGYHPSISFASEALSEGTTARFALPKNPLSRFVTSKMVGLASLDAEDAAALLSKMPESELPRLNQAIATARANSVRVLRPKISIPGFPEINPSETLVKFLANRELVTFRSRLSALSEASRGKYESILNRADELDNGVGNLSDDAINAYMEGRATPIELPSNAALALSHDLPKLDVLPEARLLPGSSANVTIVNAAEDLWHDVSSVGKRNLIPGGKREGVFIEGSRYAARSTDEILSSPKYMLKAATMDDAPRMVEQLASRSGAEILGVVDTTADADAPLVEFTAALRMNDARAQAAAEDILSKTTPKSAEALNLIVDAQQAAEAATTQVERAEAVSLMSRAADLARDAGAGETLARQMFDGARREWHALHDSVDYDVNLWAADSLRPEVYLDATRPWIENGFGSFDRHMQRTFLPQRVINYLRTEAQMYDSFRNILGSTRDSASAMPALVSDLKQRGLPDALIEEILGRVPWRKNPDAGALLITHRLRRVLWDHMVTEGGVGAEYGFPASDWRIMWKEFHDAGLPMPDYFPETKINTVSGYAQRGAMQSLRGASRPKSTLAARGLLWETQNYDKNVVDVYTRAADTWARHEDVGDFARVLVDRYGRPVTRVEASLWNQLDHPHEVLYSLKTVKQQLGLKGQLEVDTLANISQGMSPEAAIRTAMESLKAGAIDGLDNFNSDVVAMPKSVVEAMKAQATYQLGNSGALQGYNSLMSLWKKAVLSLTPRWLVNNLVGNNFFMGIADPAAMRYALAQQLDRGTRAALEQLFGTKIIEGIEQGFWKDLDNAKQFGAQVPNAFKLENRVPGPVYRPLKKFSDWMYHFNTVKEQAARRGVFLSAAGNAAVAGWIKGFRTSDGLLKQIFEKGVTKVDLVRAITAVNRTLGDFERFGPVEQYIVRRFLFPFYGFYRHAVKFTARMPFEHPLKATILRQIDELDKQMYADYPDYLQGAVRLGELGPNDLMLRLQRLNPLASLVGDKMPILSSLNPLLKIFLERQTGIDTFTGQPFTKPGDVFDVGGTKWEILRDGNGAPIGVRRVTGQVLPGYLQHFGGLIPQLPLISSLFREIPGLSSLPALTLYPKSFLLNLTNYLGASVTLTDVDQQIMYNRLNELQAQSEMYSQSLKG